MQTFYLTRKEMSQLLLVLQGKSTKTPLAILQEVWVKTHKEQVQYGKSLDAFISTSLPPIFEKMIRIDKQDIGLSLNDVVALGGQIEYTHFSVTSVQNWVKRDFKDLIGNPHHGKKYSIEQGTMLFIIEDLKSSLDFESIRKLLLLLFHDSNHLREDLINPVDLYMAYSTIFEEMDRNNDQVLDVGEQLEKTKGLKQDHLMETLVKQRADLHVSQFEHLSQDQREAISNTIVIAMLSVQTSYFQTLAKRFLNATLFLQHLN